MRPVVILAALAVSTCSAAAIGLGTLQQSTQISTPSNSVNTTIHVFDPSEDSSVVSVESVETQNYTIRSSAVNTTDAPLVSRLYSGESYVEVYALPLSIELTGNKSSYRFPVNVQSRPVFRPDGVTPVVSRRIPFEIDYTGRIPETRTEPRLEFGSQNASKTEPPQPANPSAGDDSSYGEANDSQAVDGSRDTSSGSDSPNPVLLLFIVVTAGYILWKI